MKTGSEGMASSFEDHAAGLVERGAEVVAVDGSPAMVELARTRLGSSARVVHADLTEPLPFAAAEFT